jgi:hypothetical protein
MIQRPSSVRKPHTDTDTDVWCVPSSTFTGSCILTSFLDNLSSLSALLRALDDLDALFESIEDAYKASLMHDKIVLWDERR